MNYYVLRVISIIVLPALFVYLIAAFLLSTFDINLWYPHQRFFTVVVYLLVLGGIGESERRTRKSDEAADSEAVKEETSETV